MLSPQALMRGLVYGRSTPTPNTDGNAVDQALRLGRYQEADVVGRAATKYPYLDEGSYWQARTPTPGAGVSYTINTSFSDTVPWLYLFNNNPVGGANVYLDYLKTIVTVAGASATTFQYAVKLDQGQRAPTTNHVTQATPICGNLANNSQSGLQVFYQSSATASAIPAASTNARVVAEGSIGGITIVSDEIVIEFGKTDQSASFVLTAAQATFPGRKVSSAPPIIIAPQTNAVFYLWMANNASTALSYSFELAWLER